MNWVVVAEKFLKKQLAYGHKKQEGAMKKVMSVVAVVVLLVAGSAFAQESEKISTFVDVQNTFAFPQKGEDSVGQAVNVLWSYKNVSALLETNYVNKYDSFTIKPSLIFSRGSWSILGGLASNDQGANFAQAGIWYSGKFGRVNAIADVRNYFSTTGQSNGYLDSFFRFMYPLTDKLSIGTDLIADYWWEDGNS